MIRFLRDILVFKTTNNVEHLYSVTEEEKRAVQDFAAKIPMELGLNVIRELTELESSLKWSSNQRILIETAFLRICSREIIKENDDILER